MSDAATNAGDAIQGVLLAGGRGTRLQPYSAVFPKPLVPLGDRPVLEILLRRLRHFGLTNLAVCTGHLAELIQAFFGDGTRFGVNLTYAREEQPLGTAGPLGLLRNLADPFITMNGDLLTTLDIAGMLTWHRQQRADATIAVYPRDVTIDFGVIEMDDDGILTGYREKPRHEYHVSMGIYIFARHVVDMIEPARRLDIPQLIERIRSDGGRVCCYREKCYWLDIGRPDDYALAQKEFERNPSTFLPLENASDVTPSCPNTAVQTAS